MKPDRLFCLDTEQAQENVERLYREILAANSGDTDAAESFVERVIAAKEALEEDPRIGHWRPDLSRTTGGVRFDVYSLPLTVGSASFALYYALKFERGDTQLLNLGVLRAGVDPGEGSVWLV